LFGFSTSRASTRAPSPLSSLADSGARAVAMTVSPRSASWRASSRPMPRLAPVTRLVCAIFAPRLLSTAHVRRTDADSAGVPRSRRDREVRRARVALDQANGGRRGYASALFRRRRRGQEEGQRPGRPQAPPVSGGVPPGGQRGADPDAPRGRADVAQGSRG